MISTPQSYNYAVALRCERQLRHGQKPLKAVLAKNSEFADKKTARQLMVG